MQHVVRRATSAILLAGLAAGILTGAASAAPGTVFVGPAPITAGGGACDDPDFSTIQGAVDAVGAGATILVCPGTYAERVRVNTSGLTIRATIPWKAVLRPPSFTSARARPAGIFDLLSIDGASGVTVQWLKLVSPGGGDCLIVDRMIRVSRGATNVTIRANRIRAGRDAFLGGCGYDRGIEVSGASSAAIGYNLVQDFRGRGRGIVVTGPGSTADIVANSIRYHHADSAPDTVSQEAFGIEVSGGASAQVRRNAIVGLASAGGATPRLGSAITLDEAGQDTLVKANRVRYSGNGILLLATPGARIIDNEVRDGLFGIYLTPGSTGNTLRGNTALGQYYTDCYDHNVGTGGTNGTDNVWTSNIGVIGVFPTGICTPPAP